ncbi:lysophospholipid acyltransferase family protein [Polyangium sp. y55x31]|uniref:lysophospholipid acyltransferase family protein n=1 Tax=Polyangium sp. y55x31 TaxID=3042688 RepID=UPI0024829DED|nr:lysophospholipid acyltransferase family protein [Polyangium sp. y55x31]MDI1478273.1 lysophospholipid acyltransferase family protein [Polyangium sp. y55x31]
MVPLAPTGWMLAQTESGRRFAQSLATQLRATLHGDEHVPRNGGALLVGNHAFLGIDAFALAALLLLHTGRLPRFLAERNLFRIPGVREVLRSMGAIPGTPDDAAFLLEAGEVVVVYPGGVDDSFKLSSDAYTLRWQGRAGFARVAMRARVPIVPFAATGVDELYHLDRREHFLGRWFGGSSRYDIPLPSGLRPRRVPLDYYLLPPIDTAGDPNDVEAVERIRRATEEAIRSVLDPYRAGLSSSAR